MTYSPRYAEQLLKKFNKLAKKNKKQLVAINKKIKEILASPYHFKPLRGDLKGSKRVHFGHFVLTYEIDEDSKEVRFLDYDHHDKIYE